MAIKGIQNGIDSSISYWYDSITAVLDQLGAYHNAGKKSDTIQLLEIGARKHF